MGFSKLKLGFGFYVSVFLAFSPAMAQQFDLPMRDGPQPRTTMAVPHIQLGIDPVPELNDELLRRVDAIPGVSLGPTLMSLPGAIGFQLESDIKQIRQRRSVRGGEFAHMHPDGSLHASLDPAIAKVAVKQGWAVPHPWADRPGWEGFVMIFTPVTSRQLEIVVRLVEESYRYITGHADPQSSRSQ